MVMKSSLSILSMVQSFSGFAAEILNLDVFAPGVVWRLYSVYCSLEVPQFFAGFLFRFVGFLWVLHWQSTILPLVGLFLAAVLCCI
ncbi:hypothetical protein L2E82_35842 [Cichorium intybus]|uniref:Uncharacterized protein n=1 Tax=Cichorium intybus TaxID=13427 RepID=A0ACB9BPZ9_CICIN|nr:hypothetical protein L2E82_35842 [Cichorium intybus]